MLQICMLYRATGFGKMCSLTAAVLLQSTRPLTSRTTCSMAMHTWLLDLPVGWLVWLQAWQLALWAMLVSGAFAAFCLLCNSADEGTSAMRNLILPFEAALSVMHLTMQMVPVKAHEQDPHMGP